MRIKPFLRRQLPFRSDLNQVYSQFMHVSLGIILVKWFGIIAILIPILKELMDIWLWEGIAIRKTLRDLLFWYLGVLIGYKFI